MPSRPALLLAILALSVASCAHEDFRVELAPGVRESHPTISVAGVYREGRLSPESWDLVGPKVSRALGSPMCQAGFTDALRERNPALYDELDATARREGVTDELFEKLAPSARGDIVMVVHFYGAIAMPPSTRKHATSAAPPTPGGSPALPSTRRGGLGMSNAGMGAGPENFRGRTSNVQVAASLYSAKERRIVGEIGLEMEGKDSDAAIAKFTERLATELRGATCTGWTWGAGEPGEEAGDAGAASADAGAAGADAGAAVVP